jgi:hypothetical protein
VRRIGLSNVQLDGAITLTYTNIDTLQLLTLLAHWRQVRGTTLDFRLPAELFPSISSTTRALLMATTWRHKEGPKVVDICGGQPDFLLHSLEFTIVAQPRRVASPVLESVPELSLPVVPVTAPGALLRVAAVFAPGAAGINTINLPGAAWVLSPVWLPGAAGTPGNINAPGAAWAVSVEIGAGARTTPSAALNLSTSWATGKGSIGGVAPGAAWTNNVALAAGAASVSLVVAPGAALAAGVAWAPGSASITGGTAPGALLALGTGWQPGGAQGIAPGAAWSVSAALVPGDQIFSSRRIILNFVGADNSTTFTDSSSNNFTMTRYGGAQIIANSLSLDGNGDFIVTPASSQIVLGNNYWCVETFAEPSTGTMSGKWLFGTLDDFPVGITLGVFDNVWAIGSNWKTSTQIVANERNHVALTYQSDQQKLRLFVGGTLVHEISVSGTLWQGNQIVIGNAFLTDSTAWPGKIGPFRVTRGSTLASTVYTASFTPPTGPFPTS